METKRLEGYGAYEIIMMLDNLHKRGYEQLRILPGLAPSGCSWRWMIYPKVMMKDNAYLEQHSDYMYFECPCGSTGEMKTGKDINLLADEFIELYEPYVSIADGEDVEYMEWYQQIVEMVKENNVPIAFADFPIGQKWLCGKSVLEFPPFSPVDLNELSDSRIIMIALLLFDDRSKHELREVLEYTGIKPTEHEISETIRKAIREDVGLMSHIDYFDDKEPMELFAWSAKD